eukprot:TRINITY_DN1502_c0_g1_i4.p1 TRINITY_DN1502_c0_g1~~TRINITY_DN1502_c0_g1_i4.p1  ORF type:complete len:154 (-),score=20.85 TRINITY_DN1502_c0_g1_i4:24-485(-)
MRRLCILALLCVAIRTQLDRYCVHDRNCQKGPAPCIGSSCICDSRSMKCKLALRQPCSEAHDHCSTDTVCVKGECLSYERKYCASSGDCIPDLICIKSACTPRTSISNNRSRQSEREKPKEKSKEKLEVSLSLIHICRCRRYAVCRSRWSPYH